MEENKTEIVNETNEFDNIGKREIVMESKKSRHHHHHSSHHHSSSSSSKPSDSNSKTKKKSRSEQKDDKAKKLKKLQQLKKYVLSGWVAILTVLAIVLVSWNFELNSQLKIHTDILNGVSDMVKNEVVNYGGGQNSANYVVPEYWQESVDEAIEKVQKLMDEAGRDAVAFAWFSELHYYPGAMNSATGAITAAVMDACSIPFALSSGDVLTQSPYKTEEEVRDAYDAVYDMLSPIGADRLLQVEGNHDGSWGQLDFDNNGKIENEEFYCYNMTEEQLYNIMFRRHSNDSRRVFDAEGTWYYIDEPASKTRFIMLSDVWTEYDTDPTTGISLNNKMRNKGFGQTQLTWLAEEALDFEEDGWAVVLSAHIPINNEEVRDREVAQGILEAFVNKSEYTGSYGTEGNWDYVDISVDYSDKTNADVIGFYSGHIHKDSIYVKLSYPVISITANNDISYDDSEEERVVGTDNEVAVDFVVVNRRTHEVNIVRLGVGEDRSYTF